MPTSLSASWANIVKLGQWDIVFTQFCIGRHIMSYNNLPVDRLSHGAAVYPSLHAAATDMMAHTVRITALDP